jgi:hypothetical protein
LLIIGTDQPLGKGVVEDFRKTVDDEVTGAHGCGTKGSHVKP